MVIVHTVTGFTTRMYSGLDVWWIELAFHAFLAVGNFAENFDVVAFLRDDFS